RIRFNGFAGTPASQVLIGPPQGGKEYRAQTRGMGRRTLARKRPLSWLMTAAIKSPIQSAVRPFVVAAPVCRTTAVRQRRRPPATRLQLTSGRPSAIRLPEQVLHRQGPTGI